MDFQLSRPLFPICVFALVSSALVRSWSVPGEIALSRGGYTIEFFDLPSVIATNTTCYPQGFATPGAVRSITFATRSQSDDQPGNLLAAGVASSVPASVRRWAVLSRCNSVRGSFFNRLCPNLALERSVEDISSTLLFFASK